MQIFELTSGKRNLKEYDPSRSPPGTPNYATGVGPGVKPQMTATPTVSGASTVAAATGNTVNKADPANPNIAAQTPYVQGRSGQGDNPTRFAKYDPSTSSMANLGQGMQVMTAPATAPAPATTNFGTGVGPGARSQMTATPTVSGTSTVAPAPAATPTPAPAPAASPSQPTYNVPLANVPAQPAMMPSNMSTTGAPVASSAAGVDPALAAAGKVKMGAPQGRKANIGGAIANAMQAYNANKVGLGYLLPKDAKNEVYTDSTGKITIDGVPYDAANPEHQQIVGKITIGGKPYNGANPEHRAAYLAFKNTAGRGGSDTVKIDANGKVTILGQPFDPANPAHVQAYRQHVLGSSVARTPPPAPQQQPPAASQPPATQQPPVARPAQPGQPSPAAQTPEQIRLAKQKAAAAAAQQSMTPKVTTTESLIWSRSFDPGATLYKKMKSQS